MILHLPGFAALSDFRLEKYLSVLQSTCPFISRLQAFYEYFIDTADELPADVVAHGIAAQYLFEHFQRLGPRLRQGSELAQEQAIAGQCAGVVGREPQVST